MKAIKDLKLQEAAKLNSLKEDELKKELQASLKKAFVLRMKNELGELKQVHLIKYLRRYIARIKTVANAKWFHMG